jgi:hypothetical protein
MIFCLHTITRFTPPDLNKTKAFFYFIKKKRSQRAHLSFLISMTIENREGGKTKERGTMSVLQY